MKRSSILRRVVASAAALAIGLGGGLAAAAPAQATIGHFPTKTLQGTVEGSVECDTETGDYVITWTVTNKAKLTGASVVKEYSVPGMDSFSGNLGPGQSLTATQTVPGDTAGWAKLGVKFTWKTGFWSSHHQQVKGKVKLSGECKQDAPEPTAELTQNCTDVFVTLSNAEDATKDAVFHVTGEGFEQTVTLAAGESESLTIPASAGTVTVVEENSGEQWSHTWEDSPECHPVELRYASFCDGLLVRVSNPAEGAATTAVLTPSAGDAVTVDLGPGDSEDIPFLAGEAALTVTVVIGDDEPVEVVWERPAGCEPLEGWVTHTCDGLEFEANNPEDGSEATVVFTPSVGEPVERTLAPGESFDDVFFAGGPEGLTVEITLNGELVDEVVWERPEGCDEATPVPDEDEDEGEGGSLPVTGAATTIVAGGALALLALGGGLFMVARRRRVSFTA